MTRPLSLHLSHLSFQRVFLIYSSPIRFPTNLLLISRMRIIQALLLASTALASPLATGGRPGSDASPSLAPLSKTGEHIDDSYIVVFKKGTNRESMALHLSAIEELHLADVSDPLSTPLRKCRIGPSVTGDVGLPYHSPSLKVSRKVYGCLSKGKSCGIVQTPMARDSARIALIILFAPFVL